MRTSLTIDLRHTALLLVDLQDEQRHDPRYSVAGFDAVVGNARRILLAARERRVPVFHAAYRRDFQTHPSRPFEPKAENGAPAFSDKASPLTAICKEVEPVAGEPVIHKNDASAFCEGKLQPLLAAKATEWLIVSGVWTEACVAASVRDAMAHGLRVLLVKDACGSATEAMHQTGILNLANRLYGGAVADTARTPAAVQRRTCERLDRRAAGPNLFQLRGRDQTL